MGKFPGGHRNGVAEVGQEWVGGRAAAAVLHVSPLTFPRVLLWPCPQAAPSRASCDDMSPMAAIMREIAVMKKVRARRGKGTNARVTRNCSAAGGHLSVRNCCPLQGSR